MLVPEHIERLIKAVYEFLTCQQQAVTEHQLLVELATQGVWKDLTQGSAILQQFQKHFLTMHALYRLQLRLARERVRLIISPGAILLPPPGTDELTRANWEADQTQRDYYLDLNHLAAANESSAAELLREFFIENESWKKPEDAYETLGLPSGAGWPAVQSAYRRKASTYHPDRGGSSDDFQSLRSAYESLKRTLRP